MGFYSNFLSLCNKDNKSPSRVVLEIGLKKSAVTRWKNGGNPTDATVQKIADYFNVPVSELLDEKEKSPSKSGEGDHAIDYADDDLKEYLHRKQEEEEALFEFRNISGINERQARIIKIYHDKPHSVFTSKEFVASLGVTEKTIRTDLENLVRLGLLERVPRNKRLISYIASDAFDSRLREIKGE